MDQDSVKKDEMLCQYTFTKTGGKGDYVVFPSSYGQVEKVFKYAYSNDIPLTILGNGSNLIIRDGGIRGIVLFLTRLDAITVKGNVITAQSGAKIIDVSQAALAADLTGLEFACGIPGSVGGAMHMNAGAYGGEISTVVTEVLALDREGKVFRMPRPDMDLGYRSSIFAKKGYVVLEATFELSPGNRDEIKAKMDELTFLRESKQPLEYPSCGSVFKRPEGHFAGKLIQDSGLQGKQIGGAQVSTKHAGFIVNVGGATASDYMALIKHVQETVMEKFGVALEMEVRVIGEDE
ncbi:UDP-N-acetylmuramate dehydrogenase [Bacillus massilinigeriensis]|uniref:UDP-N-acetylmuramate dehydrogenase n=1 Tax=Bacillus mediterraneensis TaxID=1805474 RepID=UPI0008F95FCD|nr:UDP-N-acetylmuramate dehydrogenase [Bacillus mediterraneensis]